MAKNRERRTGFVARWFRRIWWLRRVVVLGAIVGAAVKAVRSRGSGGSGAVGSGGFGGGPGGSGKPAPIGGPFSPSRSAAVTPPSSEPESTALAGGVRTLVSVPPLADTEAVAGADGTDDDADDDDTPVTGASLSAVTDTIPDAAPAADPDRTWVEPLADGSCPPSHPVKANDNSGIYHVPGGRFYNRTVAERCYTTAEAAEADGYRPAKA